jgi:hypothetical protein
MIEHATTDALTDTGAAGDILTCANDVRADKPVIAGYTTSDACLGASFTVTSGRAGNCNTVAR